MLANHRKTCSFTYEDNHGMKAIFVSIAVVIALWFINLQAVKAEEPPPSASAGEVQLNFPENADLRLLVDYVSQRLNISLIM